MFILFFQSFLITTVLITCVLSGNIFPTKPVNCAILDADSRTLLTLYFRVATALPDGNYLRIDFPSYLELRATIEPMKCKIQYYSATGTSWFISENCQADPGISPNSVFVQLSQPLQNSLSSENILQLELLNLNTLSSPASSLRVSTVSAADNVRFIQYDRNVNFGMVPFTPTHFNFLRGTLSITLIGVKEIYEISIDLRRDVGLFTRQSRIKVIVDSPWNFVKDTNAISLTHTIQSSTVETPNQLSIIIDSTLNAGMSVTLQIEGLTLLADPTLRFPLTPRYLKVFTLELNSNESIESNPEFQRMTIPPTINMDILTPFEINDSQTPIKFYRNTLQTLIVKVQLGDTPIPASFPIVLQFSQDTHLLINTLHLSSNMVDETTGETWNQSIEFPVAGQIIIRNLAKIDQNSMLTIEVDALLSRVDSFLNVDFTVYMEDSLSIEFLKGAVTIPLSTNQSIFLTSVASPSLETPSNSTIIIPSNYNLGVIHTPVDIQINRPISDPGEVIITTILTLHMYIPKYLNSNGDIRCTYSREQSGSQESCNVIEETNTHIVIELNETNHSLILSSDDSQNVLIFSLTLSFDVFQSNAQFYFRVIEEYTSSEDGGSDGEISSSLSDTNNSNVYFDILFPVSIVRIQSDSEEITARIINRSFSELNNIFIPSFFIISLSPEAVAARIRARSNGVSTDSLQYISLLTTIRFDAIEAKSIQSIPCRASGNTDIECLLRPYQENELVRIDILFTNLQLASEQDGFSVIIPTYFNSEVFVQYSIEAGVYNRLSTEYEPYSISSVEFSSIIERFESQTTCDEASIEFVRPQDSQVENSNAVLSVKSELEIENASVLIIISEWEFWKNGISDIIGPLIVTSGDLRPISVAFTDLLRNEQRFAILFFLSSPISGQIEVTLNSVIPPFVNSLQFFSAMLTGQSGMINCVSHIQQLDSGQFAGSVPEDLESSSMDCIDMIQGILNTQCTIKFQINLGKNLDIDARIRISFLNTFVNTNSCDVIFKINTTPPTERSNTLDCSVTNDSKWLTILLENKDEIEAGSTIEISTFGYQLGALEEQKYTIQTRFPIGHVVRQKITNILVVPNTINPYVISITNLDYTYLNPLVLSELTIRFTIPRKMYPNEYLVAALGTDLSDVNTNTDRMRFLLARITAGTGTGPTNVFNWIPVIVIFQSTQIFLEPVDMDAIADGNYAIVISQIMTPKAHSDQIRLWFSRRIDRMITVASTDIVAEMFPVLISKQFTYVRFVNAFFLLEGSFSEYEFEVSLIETELDFNSKILLFFPVYYSTSIANEVDFLLCTINSQELPCMYSDDIPFCLEIKEFPFFIDMNTRFNLAIKGILAPSYQLRNYPMYFNDTILFAVDTGLENSYSEYVHLRSPDVTRMPLDFPYLRILSLDVAVTFTRSLSTHTFQLQADTRISILYNFQVILTKEYEWNRIATSVQCSISVTRSGVVQESPESTCSVNGFAISGKIPFEIEKREIFSIILKDIRTPLIPSTVNPSLVLITIFDDSRLTYLTRTFGQANQAGLIQFSDSDGYISVNGASEIQLIRGTYTNEIIIEKTNGLKSGSNVVVSLASPGLVFIESTIRFVMGKKQSTFRVGTSRHQSAGIVEVAVTYSEAPFDQIYALTLPVLVQVGAGQFEITLFPSSISIHSYLPSDQGLSCSLPVLISLPSNPFQNLTIAIEYDYSIYSEKEVQINQELSSHALVFYPTTQQRIFSLCITHAFPSAVTTTFDVKLALAGMNFEAYSLQNDGIVTVNIIPSSTTTRLNNFRNLLSDFTIRLITAQRTSARIEFDRQTSDGSIFWHIFIDQGSASSKRVDLSAIKLLLKNDNPIINQLPNQQERFIRFQSINDERVGIRVVLASDLTTPWSLELNDLAPELSYSVCAYFEDLFGNSIPASQCLTFQTQPWEEFLMARIQFEPLAFDVNMNQLLCFFARHILTRMENVVNADGQSCSMNIFAAENHFAFKGRTTSNSIYQTNLYFVPDSSFEIDTSLPSARDIFDRTTNQITTASLDAAMLMFRINFIQQSSFAYSFSFDSAIHASTSNLAIPSIVSIDFKRSSTLHTSDFEMRDIELSQDGQLYYIVELMQKQFQDPFIGSRSQIPMQVLNELPTPMNIISCQNSLGYEAHLCGRAIINNNQKVTVILRDLFPEIQHSIFYIVANHFPLQPIYGDKVFTYDFVSLPIRGIRITASILVLFVISLF